MAYNYPNSIGHGGKNRTHCRWLADAFCAKISYVKSNSFIVILPPLFARRPPAPGGRRPRRHPLRGRPPRRGAAPSGMPPRRRRPCADARLSGRASAKSLLRNQIFRRSACSLAGGLVASVTAEGLGEESSQSDSALAEPAGAGALGRRRVREMSDIHFNGWIN